MNLHTLLKLFVTLFVASLGTLFTTLFLSSFSKVFFTSVEFKFEGSLDLIPKALFASFTNCSFSTLISFNTCFFTSLYSSTTFF